MRAHAPLLPVVLLAASACMGAIGDPRAASDGASDPSRASDPIPEGGCEGSACLELEESPPPTTRFPRLTHTQWELTVQELLRLEQPTGLSSEFNAEATSVTSALWQDYQRAAERVAGEVTASGADIAFLPATAADASSDLTARRDAFLSDFAARAYRRSVGDAEIDPLRELFDAGPEAFPEMDDPFAAGARMVVAAVLQSPFFLYRVERSADAVDGLVYVDAFELASRLSFLLWDSMPDDELFAHAASGALSDEETLLGQAERMLDDPRAHAKLARFHDELLEVDRFTTYVHDLPEWRPEIAVSMQQEIRLLVEEVVENGGTIRELLTTNVSFVDESLAALYGIDGVSGSEMQRVTLDPTQRSGVLTRPGLLAKNTDYDPDPVHRGVFIAERIVCRGLPPPPVFDPATLMPTGDTNRERYESITGVGTCGATCHALVINPLGFPFESYDALGRWREDDGGHAIDTATTYTTENGEEVSVGDGIELSAALAELDETHVCYAEQLLEFIYGRRATDGDSPLVYRTSVRSFSGDPLRDLLLELVASRTFRTRAVEEIETEESRP